MTRRATLVCVLALASACRESDEIAQTIVWVDAEPAAQAALSRVTVQATGPADNRLPAVTARDPVWWPIKLVLAPKDGDASRRFTLHIEARDAQDSPVAVFRFKTGFVANQTRSAKLLIHAACVTPPRDGCDADERCNEWSLELAANELGQGETQPHTVDANCVTTTEPEHPSESDASVAEEMPTRDTAAQAGSSAGADASTGPTGGAAGAAPVGMDGRMLECGPGYIWSSDACVDIDECETASPCGEHGRCENTPGTYECQCDAGYETQSGTCRDIDECLTDNGGCESTCTNTVGGAACTCASTEWLKADRKACGRLAAARRVDFVASAIPTQPRFAFDADGNGVAVWAYSDGMQTSLWSRRYVAGLGWSAIPSKVAIADAGQPSAARLALDPSGHGVLVWVLTADSHSDIWSARYDGQSFSGAAKIETNDAGNASDPSVALDNHGNGFAAWTQSNGTHTQIWVNRLRVDTGWSGAQPMLSASDEDAFGARLAVDALGNASLAWTQSYVADMEASRYTAWATHFDVDEARWRLPRLLDDTGGAGFPDTQLFGPDGQGLAIWPRLTDQRVSIRASVYAQSGWSESINIAAPDSELGAVLPRLALSASGRGVAVWPQPLASGAEIWANRYDRSVGAWTGAVEVRSFDATQPVFPQVALDSVGDGFAVWSEIQGTARVNWAWRVQAEAGFVAGVQLSTDVTADPPVNSIAQIAVDDRGDAVVIWDVLNAGQYETWASVFE